MCFGDMVVPHCGFYKANDQHVEGKDCKNFSKQFNVARAAQSILKLHKNSKTLYSYVALFSLIHTQWH